MLSAALVVAAVGAGPVDSPVGNPRAAAFTFFVNFDGAVLNGDGEDARQNASETAALYDLTGAYPPWGGTPSQREAVLAAVRGDWAAYDVDVVTERPSTGEYSMVMVGPREHALGMGVYGVGPTDCFNQNHNNVALTFLSADDLGGSANVSFQATQISQELAHSAGLEHVTGDGAEQDIMFPGAVAPTASFTPTCLASTGQILCAQQHADLSQSCAGGEQSSHEELLALFGPASADVEDPTVEIQTPADGEVIAAGDDLEVAASADDDVGVAEVELFVDGESAGPLTTAPFSWILVGVPAGAHELLAIARDEAGNEAQSAVVSVTAQEPAGGPDSCACRAAPRPSWGLFLAGAAALRRRRRTAR